MMRYDPQSHLVGVGLDDGQVNILKLSSHLSLGFEEMANLKDHTLRINGIEFDSKRGYVYTVAEDSKFIATDLRQTEKVLDISVGSYALAGLFNNAENSRIFVSNTNAQIYIMDILTFFNSFNLVH